MEIENPLALSFIIQEDIFLLNKDKSVYDMPAAVTADVVSTPQEIQPAVIDFNYLGSNTNGLLILVHYPAHEFIAEAHLTALENILNRKGLPLKNAAILNMNTHFAADIETITAYFKPQKMLILGKSAMPGGLPPIALNQLKQTGDFLTLYSFTFDEMMDSNDNKKAFWEQMKLL
jgi:hypothetical protein